MGVMNKIFLIFIILFIISAKEKNSVEEVKIELSKLIDKNLDNNET
jgi:hypothetical protein